MITIHIREITFPAPWIQRLLFKRFWLECEDKLRFKSIAHESWGMESAVHGHVSCLDSFGIIFLCSRGTRRGNTTSNTPVPHRRYPNLQAAGPVAYRILLVFHLNATISLEPFHFFLNKNGSSTTFFSISLDRSTRTDPPLERFHCVWNPILQWK